MSPSLFLILPFYAFLFWMLVKTILHFIRHWPTRNNHQQRPFQSAEILWCGVAPLVGGFFSLNLMDSLLPLAAPYNRLWVLLIFLYHGAYWFSRTKLIRLDGFSNWLVAGSQVFGIMLNLVLFLHFMSFKTIIALWFLPFIGFSMVAPGLATVYQWMELRSLFYREQDRLQSLPAQLHQAFHKTKILQWQGVLLILIGLFGLTVLLSLLFGHPYNSMWLALHNSHGFWFSKH